MNLDRGIPPLRGRCWVGTALLMLSVCGLGCGRASYAPKDYFAWLNEEDNGLIISKTAGDVKLTVKYIPPEVRAYQEIQMDPDLSKRSFDSLYAFYDRSRCFVMSVGHSDPANRSDVAMTNVSGREEIAARLDSLNFALDDAIRLSVGDREFKPALIHMDGDFGMSAVRRFTVVFVDESSSREFEGGDSYTFLFNDPVFHSGSSRFLFPKDRIENRPALAIQ